MNNYYAPTTRTFENGVTIRRRYALWHCNVDEIEDFMDDNNRPEIDTFDPYEISAQVGGREEDDEKWCVEYYWADEEGEFFEGSDYDYATRHYERFHVEEGR